MRPLAIKFPPSDGKLVTLLRAGLTPAYGTGLTVARKLPDTKTRRMVTVRNDGGPDDGTQSRRRYGFNVWSDDSVEAEQVALDAMAILRTCADGAPITFVDGLSGPYEIDDDPQMTVGDKNLYRFFFTAQISVRASNV